MLFHQKGWGILGFEGKSASSHREVYGWCFGTPAIGPGEARAFTSNQCCIRSRAAQSITQLFATQALRALACHTLMVKVRHGMRCEVCSS